MENTYYKKTITGFVTQTFDMNGNCDGQTFTASDETEVELCNMETGESKTVEIDNNFSLEYFPFDMVQPPEKNEK